MNVFDFFLWNRIGNSSASAKHDLSRKDALCQFGRFELEWEVSVFEAWRYVMKIA